MPPTEELEPVEPIELVEPAVPVELVELVVPAEPIEPVEPAAVLVPVVAPVVAGREVGCVVVVGAGRGAALLVGEDVGTGRDMRSSSS